MSGTIIFIIGYLVCILGGICILGLLFLAIIEIWWKVYKHLKWGKELVETLKLGAKAKKENWEEERAKILKKELP